MKVLLDPSWNSSSRSATPSWGDKWSFLKMYSVKNQLISCTLRTLRNYEYSNRGYEVRLTWMLCSGTWRIRSIAHIHTETHTHSHTHTHKHTHSLTHTLIHSYTHTHTRTLTLTHTQSHLGFFKTVYASWYRAIVCTAYGWCVKVSESKLGQ